MRVCEFLRVILFFACLTESIETWVTKAKSIMEGPATTYKAQYKEHKDSPSELHEVNFLYEIEEVCTHLNICDRNDTTKFGVCNILGFHN